jgi:hypothetical protein
MVTRIVAVFILSVSVVSFHMFDRILLLDTLSYTKWIVVYSVFCCFGAIVSVLLFFSSGNSLRKSPRVRVVGYYLILMMFPVLVVLGIETAMFGYTQRNEQWRLLNRNFSAYGEIESLRQYMEDTAWYRSNRPDRDEQQSLKGYLPAQSESYYVNQDGYRTREFKQRLVKEYRIGFFGGSTTWGSWVTNQETVPAYLERALSAANPGFPRIQVYNLGIEAVGLSSELKIAQSTFPKVAYDHLIFYDGVNDLPTDYLIWKTNQSRKGEKPSDASTSQQSVDSTAQLIVRANIAQRFLSKLSDFEIVQTAKYFINSARLTASHVSDEEIPMTEFSALVDKGVERYLTTYEKVRRFCEEKNVPCHFFIQPFIGHKTPLTDAESRIHSYVNMKTPDYIRYYDAVADQIFKKNYNNIYDLRQSIQNVDGEMLADAVHMTKLGNRVVSGAMAEKVKLKSP